jgi:DNA-binding NarL/FixJ family response regulator/tRNA A-37 threonylcarbamoyl transferase component Bud32
MIWDKFTNKKPANDKPAEKTAQEQTVERPLVCIECSKEWPADKKTCPDDGGILVTKKAQSSLAGEFLVGSTFVDRYKILSVLGEGGMSIVYKAHHSMMDRVVAIKILKHFESSGEKMFFRFQQEARAASSLNHNSLITIYDFGVTPEGRAYLVMDYLEGKSLEAVILEGPLEAERAAKIFMQVCDGLEHAHSKGVIHRDIKPSNIILITNDKKQELVKIVDFGIAKLMPEAKKETFHLTQAGQLFGSPLFMSPEQCANRKIDNRTDVYALGATMYNALAGRPPFEGATLAEVIYQHLKEIPQPFSKLGKNLKVPESLEKTVLKCLEKESDLRYQSMSELRAALAPNSGAAPAAPEKKAAPKANMIKVVLAEDSDAVAATITNNVATAGGAFVASRAVNGAEAIDKVMQTMPQVVLVDVKVPVMDGIEVTKQLKATSPNLRVLLYSISDNPNDIIPALNAGADGYIMQDLSPGRLGPAIKAVVSGIPWIDPEITSRVLRNSTQAAAKAGPDIATKHAKNEKLDHAQYLETLGSIYVQEKKYDEAEALFHGSIALAEKAYGKDCAQVASTSAKLADLYMANKKSGAAEHLYLRALEIRVQTLGQEHLDVAASLESLALLFKVSGSLEQAERFFLWAMRIREKLLPPNDGSLADIYSKIAGLYRAMGRISDANQMDKKAKQIQETVLSQTNAM